MQLLIDTVATPKFQLRAIAELLLQVVATMPDESQSFTTDSTAKAGDALPPLPLGIFGGSSNAQPAPFIAPTAAPAPTPPPVSTPVLVTSTPVVVPPVTQVAPVSVQTNLALSTDLDKDGLPWDERIHANSKAKVADGTWRKRKNLAPGTYDAIVAELRVRYPAATALTHTPNAAPPPPPAPAAAVPPPPPPPAPVSLPPVAANPGLPVGVQTVAGQKPLEFKDVAFKAAQYVNAGKMSNAQIPAVVSRATAGQLANMGQLLTDPRGAGFLQAFSDELDRTANSLVTT